MLVVVLPSPSCSTGLAGCLGGELLPRGLTTSGLACGLLRSSHAERGALLWASTVSPAETVDQLANEIDVGTTSGFRVGPAGGPAFLWNMIFSLLK